MGRALERPAGIAAGSRPIVAWVVLALFVNLAAPVEATPGRASCKGRSATIVGTPGSDRLIGTRGRDVIAGLAGNDSIISAAGNDIVCGGRGFDRIRGGNGDDYVRAGQGNDRVKGGSGFDQLYGEGGGDHLRGGEDFDSILPGTGDDLAFGGDEHNQISYEKAARPVWIDLKKGFARGVGRDTLKGFRQVLGSKFDDRLRGDDSSNALIGSDGNDVIVGRGGKDGLEPNAGKDSVRGGPGSDVLLMVRVRKPVRVNLQRNRSWGSGRDTIGGVENIFGSRFADVLVGNDGPNLIVNGTGDASDEMFGRGGRDGFFRLYGNNTLDGGRGRDLVFYDGNATNVNLTLGIAASAELSDSLTSIEDIQGSPEADVFFGNEKANYFAGGSGQDRLSGEMGNDELRAGRGDDVLNGGDGKDILDGGPQRDICTLGETLKECEAPGSRAPRPDRGAGIRPAQINHSSPEGKVVALLELVRFVDRRHLIQ